MKITTHKTLDRAYLVARFESFKICEFSTAVTASIISPSYVTLLSAGDTGLNRFYLLVRTTGCVYVYRDGKNVGTVFAHEGNTISFSTLNAEFPLGKST